MFEFGMFGPFTVRRAGVALPLGGTKQRTVLAVLAVHANRTVPLDDLITELWEERPPASAVPNVRTYAATLRRLLAGAGMVSPLTRNGSGYRLAVAAGACDGKVFEERIAEAPVARDRGDLAAAAAHFEVARQLWHDGPMADLPGGPVIRSYRTALEQARLTMLEDLAEVHIELSQPATATRLLGEIVTTDPLRER